MKKKTWNLYAPLFVAIVLVDQYLKYCVVNWINYYSITSWLSISLVYNRGIATGIANYTERGAFLSVTALVMATYLLFGFYTWRRHTSRAYILSEMLVLAGGFSNIIDRFAYAGVVDFIKVHHAAWVFPIFNVADMCIVIGVLGMFYSTLSSYE